MFRCAAKGDLVNWCTAEWTLQNIDVEEKPIKESCKQDNIRHIIIPEMKSQSDAISLCRKFGGSHSVMKSEAMQNELTHMFLNESEYCAPKDTPKNGKNSELC